MWLCTLPITRSSSASASLRQVHGAVFHDVALQAGEDADARAPSRLSSRTWRGEGHRALFIQAVGHGQRLGMVRDGDVFVAALARGRGHLFQRGAAVGLGGVHVDIAADVRQLHQLGQAVFGGGSISPRFSRSSGGIQRRPSAS